jgi:hypothetical protein
VNQNSWNDRRVRHRIGAQYRQSIALVSTIDARGGYLGEGGGDARLHTAARELVRGHKSGRSNEDAGRQQSTDDRADDLPGNQCCGGRCEPPDKRRSKRPPGVTITGRRSSGRLRH